MGRLLEQYLAMNVPQLQDIVRGGKPQPEGATTFPMPEPGIQTQPTPSMPGPGLPNARGAAMPDPRLQAVPAPTFEGAGAPPPGPGAPPPQSAVAPVTPQRDRSAEFEESENSFMGMAKKADKKSIKKAVDEMEKAGVNINQSYAQVTGGPPKKGMTREEKGMILMEFGLSLMAQSGTGEGTLGGDIGIAGLTAFQGHQGRKAAQAKALADAEDKKLDRELKRAQIANAKKGSTTIKTDKNGNFVIIDEEGSAKPILMDGEPVQAANEEMYATEVDRIAYEELECKGLTGDAMKACKRRALAYAKGGGAHVAFPELERADQTDRVMKNLEDPDKRSAKYHVPSAGIEKRWKDMTPDEQLEVAEGFVNRRIEIINRGSVETGKTKAADETFGLSPSDIARIQPGKDYHLSNGKVITKRDGKIVEVTK